MAVNAVIGRCNMSCGFSCRRDIVMAIDTGAGELRVIDTVCCSRFRGIVTGVTRVGCRYMIFRHPSRSCTVMTTATFTDDLVMVYGSDRNPR